MNANELIALEQFNENIKKLNKDQITKLQIELNRVSEKIEAIKGLEIPSEVVVISKKEVTVEYSQSWAKFFWVMFSLLTIGFLALFVAYTAYLPEILNASAIKEQNNLLKPYFEFFQYHQQHNPRTIGKLYDEYNKNK